MSDPLATARSPNDGRQRRVALRCVTEPEAAQAALLHHHGLTFPCRLRRLDDIKQQ